ncbi:tRNA splicing ligase [Macellibacteroides fermentans]|uniref:tRNA splicing ligase n=1 Tax=Macellibacteroides fermentans TaxID=879969 RepID=A0A8E1ZWY3_9PORP|nr:tRNA splicing ligase [Macellibacteroides fermentans]
MFEGYIILCTKIKTSNNFKLIYKLYGLWKKWISLVHSAKLF